MLSLTYRRSVLVFVYLCSSIAFFDCQQIFATAESEIVRFDVPGGKAKKTLKQAAQQAELEIFFSVSNVRGVFTHSVQGEFAPIEAFNLMLADTSLAVFRHEKSGVYTIRKIAVAEDADGDSNSVNTTPMNEKKKTIADLFKGLLALAVASSPSLHAQDDRGDEEVFELSPFTVDVSSETGYRATQTLAGTRIATSLKDVAAQVDVMTTQFLDDVAAVNIEDALLYSLNVENVQEFMPNDPAANQTAGVLNLNGAARVRGLGNATRTRDYFPTFFQTDTYNSASITLNSGPNAILFGLGSAGGIINQDSQKSYFTDSNRIRLRFDSEDSIRGDFLFNRVLVEDKLAISIAGVYEDREQWRKPSYDTKERFFTALTFKPVEKTTIRASYEHIDREANWPRSSASRDYVTPYLEYRAAKMVELGISDPYDPRLYWAPGDPIDDTTPFARTSNRIRLITGSHEPIPSHLLLGNYHGADRNNQWIIGTEPQEFFRTNGSAMSRGPDRMAGVHPADRFNRSLDGSVFPYGINLGGATRVEQGGEIFMASIEQQLAENFFVELAYHTEQFDKEHDDWIRGSGQGIRIDVDRYLPQDRESSEPPQLNPNRGKFFMENWGQSAITDNWREDARANATYKLDFTQKEGWVSWLGRHNLSALFDYSRHEFGIQNGRTALYPPFPDGVVASGRGNSAAHFRVLHRVYLDDPNDPSGTDFTLDPNKHVTELVNEPFGQWNSVFVSGMPDPSFEYGVWSGGSYRTNGSKGRSIAIQSSFWDDRIIFLYGKRKDDFKTQEVSTVREANSPAPWDTRQQHLTKIAPDLSNPDVDETGTNETKGIVFHALPWISVFYNESSNSSLGAPGLNVLTGGLQPASSGEGEDYGFMLDLMEGKLQARVNWYKNSQLRNPSAQFNDIRWTIREIDNRLISWSENPDVPVPAGGPVVAPTTWDPFTSNTDALRANPLSDLVAEGTEISLTYNPSKEWRVRLSAAKTESTETNIAKTWRDYVDQRLPEWQRFYDRAWDDGLEAEPGDETVEDRVQTEVFLTGLDIAAASEGRSNDRISKWRVNLVTNYEFTEGRLKGFGVGGAIRWRDERGIGFPMTTLNGIEVVDINNPWFGEGEKNVDASISYKTRMFGEKVRAKFQLNIQNILDDTDPLPQRALTTGDVAIYRLQAPRLFVLSTSFDF